jgi:dihydroxyacetone kinase-like predicted kinase
MSARPTRLYQVEYLIAEPVQSAEAVRHELAARLVSEPQGGTIAVAGDGTLIKVHVTTARPEVALAIGRAAGALADVIVEPRCYGASWPRAA